jgi:hypothetical protein
MKNLLLYLMVIFIFFYSCSTEKTEFKIDLSFVDPDSGGYYFMGIGAERGFKNKELLKGLLFNENIIKYPDKLKLIKNYFISLQPRQSYVNLAQANEESKKLLLERFRLDNYEELKNNYSELYVDCIISIGIFENNNNNRFVIMDQNNDEDYSNDSILEFFTHDVKHGLHRSMHTLESVQANVSAQIYDGEKIVDRTYPLRFSKLKSLKHKANPIYLYSIRSMPVGNWTVGENTFRVGILNKNSQVEYSIHDRLWIDSNLNNMHDGNDISVSMNFPFLFQGKVYEVSSFDRLGKSLVIKKIKKPMVEEGKAAPEIEALTIDSTKFRLSQLKNKFVLLNFWGTW